MCKHRAEAVARDHDSVRGCFVPRSLRAGREGARPGAAVQLGVGGGWGLPYAKVELFQPTLAAFMSKKLM